MGVQDKLAIAKEALDRIAAKDGVEGFIEVLREFAFDTYHDDEEGNYSDANELMDAVKGSREIPDVIEEMKKWGVTEEEFRGFLENYVKDWLNEDENWEVFEGDFWKAFR